MKEGTMKRLLKMLWSKYKIHLIIVFLCIVGNALFNVQGTMFMQTLIDDHIVPLLKSSSPDFSGLFHALIRVGSLYACGVVCAFTFNRIMVYVTQGFLRDLRINMFEHMESLPIRYFDRTPHGDTMSVYTNDIDTLRQLISQSIPQLISSCMTIVTTFISMIILNIPLTVLSVCMLMVMLVVSRKLGSLSGKFFVKQQSDLGKVNGYIEEMISGQKVVKVFNHEDQAIADFRKLNDELRESAYQAHKFANILMPVTVQLGNISYIICAIVGAILALNGHFALTIGTLVAFLTLNKSFNQPIGQISQQINAVAMAQAGAGRIFDLLDQEEDKYLGFNERPNFKGDIKFIDVSFAYDESDVLKHINMHVKPGQFIGLVGHTGSGKSTLMILLQRFYDLVDGKILIDDVDFMNYTKQEVRSNIGYVLQEPALFSGTIKSNITFGIDASDDEVERVLEMIGAKKFVKDYPDGIHTKLEYLGSNLSTGEKQLISFARILLRNPAILILDEATANIDTETEILIQNALKVLAAGRTTFVVAHRLSTIRYADNIYVLDDGKIVESGTHDELYNKNGKYRAMYEAQYSNQKEKVA